MTKNQENKVDQKEVKKGAKLIIEIDKIIFPHLGICKIGDKEIRVKNVLPGQKVKVLIKKKKSSYYQARLLEVVETSPLENNPRCDHYNICGGCSRQSIDYQKQLEIKAKHVQELFHKNGFKDIDFKGIIPSPRIFEYRNKMEFSFGDMERDGVLQLGLHPRGRRFDVLTVNTCQLVDNDFRLILSTILDYFRQYNYKRYHIMKKEGFLRNLVIRKGLKTGEILVNLITTSSVNHDFTELSQKLQALDLKGNIVGFLQSINDNLADDVKCDRLITHFGRDYYYEELLNLKFKITPFAFFQPNTYAAEEIYKTVLKNISPDSNNIIYDLYCGTGTISQIVADKADMVYGIELIEEAVEITRANAQLNGIENCQFISGDVLKKLDDLTEIPDLIIIDPPRPGINPKALAKIIEIECPEIIYVSCNPKTLVNDLIGFRDSNYQILSVECIDMFPHTHHVETVVHIKKTS